MAGQEPATVHPKGSAPQRTSRGGLAVLLGAVLLVLAGLAAYLIFWPGLARKASPTASPDSLRSIGPAAAPVTVVEYGDFGCPTCLGWYRSGTMEKILQAYGSQVRFVWRDFPVITPQSPKAAEAGLCAADQGQFWPFHNLVYDHQGAISISDLKGYAASLKLDMQAFDKCLDSAKYQAEVEEELNDGYRHGFIGTPSFLVNNHPLVGPASFDQFKALIDPLLTKPG